MTEEEGQRSRGCEIEEGVCRDVISSVSYVY